MQYIQRITLGLTLLLLATIAQAADVTLTWDAPDDATSVAGYRLYYGNVSQEYTNNIDVGLVTTGTVKSIPRGVLTYFAVQAYDAQGGSSDFSNEVSTLVPLPRVDAPNIHQVIMTFNTQKNTAAPIVQPQQKKRKKR